MTIKILVVDDNRDTLRIYVKTLLSRLRPQPWQAGSLESILRPVVEVEDADTIRSALDKLRSVVFDILVIDLKMPGMSGEQMGGLELIEESMKLDRLRPIIVMTGYGSIELARKTLIQGVFDFIEKSATAVDDLVNAVQRALDYLNERMVRLGNPFMPMTGVGPTIFGGRTTEIEFFEQKLNRTINSNIREHFLVLGSWGIGKSTLLREFKRICQNRGYLASVVPLTPLQQNDSLDYAARSVVEGILRDLPYPVDRFRRVTELFDSVGISILGTGLELSRDTSTKRVSTQAFLHDTLVRLWQDLESKTDALLILLDDLDNFLAVPEFGMLLKQTLSMESVNKTKILVGMASTPTSWLKLTSIEKHHPLSRYFLSRIELKPLSEKEMQETIAKSLTSTGVNFSSEVIAQVFRYTQGHPFEMQLLCYHLFQNQLSRKVGIDVWEKALHATLSDMGIAVFGQWHGQASGEEAKVLHIISQVNTPITVKEIRTLIISSGAKITQGNITKYLQRLVDKRLLTHDSGSYAIPDPMFAAYVRSRR